MEDLTLGESFKALGIALINLGKNIKYSIFNEVEKLLFLFSKPKYKISQHIQIYGQWRIITKIERDWECHIYFYKIYGIEYYFSEKLVDFYQKP